MTITQPNACEGSAARHIGWRVVHASVDTEAREIVVDIETLEGMIVRLALPPAVAWNLCLGLGDHVGRHRDQYGLPPRADDPDTSARMCDGDLTAANRRSY